MTAAASPSIHPLIGRMGATLDAPFVEAEQFDEWTREAGHALAVFTEDPMLNRETLDLAVIVPELARLFAGRFRVGVLLPAAARAVATRFGFRRWPALVLLKDSTYVGAIDGLRDWHDYLQELGRLLEAQPTRPPSIGIAVRAADQDGAQRCHSA
jgi:hydrogenase-1 operon protein HyaE